jgi:Uma2 family endonuclease
MRTLVLDPQTSGLEEILERRRRSGLDRFDEVWNGVLHLLPAPSFEHGYAQHQMIVMLDGPSRTAGLVPTGRCAIGAGEHNYRVPDGALHRPGAHGTWLGTAALVIEIVSPNDETWEKLPFYAAHEVDEVLIVDPSKRTCDWLALTDGEYRPVERSGLINLGPSELAEQIEWPHDGATRDAAAR